MLKNNKRSLQVTAIAITVTLLLVGASGHVAAKAKKITINHKKMTLAIGQKRALKVKKLLLLIKKGLLQRRKRDQQRLLHVSERKNILAE